MAAAGVASANPATLSGSSQTKQCAVISAGGPSVVQEESSSTAVGLCSRGRELRRGVGEQDVVGDVDLAIHKSSLPPSGRVMWSSIPSFMERKRG